MNWSIYPQSSSIAEGAEIKFLRYFLEDEPTNHPVKGEGLVVEFPNNSRASGTVTEPSESDLTIEIDSKVWSLTLTNGPDRNSENAVTLRYKIVS